MLNKQKKNEIKYNIIHTLYLPLINATNTPIVGVLDIVIYGVFGSVIADHYY